MEDKKIDKNEVWLPSRDGFITGIVVTQTPDAYYFRDDGLWSFLTPRDTEFYLEDTTLSKVNPQHVDKLVELWDETNGVSTSTNDDWTVTELADFIA